MILMRQIDFDMGHCVSTQQGSDGLSPCLMPHGHRFTLKVYLTGDCVSDSEVNGGMVVDFREVKKILMEKIHNIYDHSFMIWENDPTASLFYSMKQLKPYPDKIHIVPFVPTSENLVQQWFPTLDTAFREKNITLESLELYETPNCACTFTKKEYYEHL